MEESDFCRKDLSNPDERVKSVEIGKQLEHDRHIKKRGLF